MNRRPSPLRPKLIDCVPAKTGCRGAMARSQCVACCLSWRFGRGRAPAWPELSLKFFNSISKRSKATHGNASPPRRREHDQPITAVIFRDKRTLRTRRVHCEYF